MTEPPAAAIEAAAEAFRMTPFGDDDRMARAILTAAAPHIAAQAWERVWKQVIECVERQADLPSLVHFDKPSDFRKGVLTVLAALNAARQEAPNE